MWIARIRSTALITVLMGATAYRAAGNGSLLIGADTVLSPAPQSRILSVVHREDSTSFSGVTPGGRAFLLRQTIETIHHTSSRLARDLEVLLDHDQDGELVLDVAGAPDEAREVWLVVDLGSRETVLLGVGIGPGSIRELALDLVSVRRPEDPGAGDLLIGQSKWLEVVLIRAGGSVLSGEAHDGGVTDAGGTVDGQIEFSLDDLVTVFAGADVPSRVQTPVRLEQGDLMFLIDPRSSNATLLLVRKRA